MDDIVKKIKAYLGYKFYKENEDKSITIYRLIRINSFRGKLILRNEETKAKVSMTLEELQKYTPLEPYGQLAFSHVLLYGNDPAHPQQDVMVMLYRYIELKMGDYTPYAICRQSVTDFFANLIGNDPDKLTSLVGTSVTRDNCPPNIDYRFLAACDEVLFSEVVNYYLDDTVESILDCVSLIIFNKALEDTFNEHIAAVGNFVASKAESIDGWCKNLKALLKENNFAVDLNCIRDITAVDFNMDEYLILNDNGSQSLNHECLRFFDYVFKVNATNTVVIKYDYDIDMAEFNHNNYTKIMDKKNNLYIVVYTVDGEYIEEDLNDKSKESPIGDKLRLAFYNKYAGK
jgi:hypothetical protein